MSEKRARQYLTESFHRLAAALQRRYAGHASGEDAVQEALVRAWQLASAGAEIRDWERWITTVATNEARMQLRRRMTEHRALARMGHTAEPVHWPEPYAHLGPVAEALGRLPARQRQVLALHYYADLPVVEIARLLGISTGGVKSALADGRRSLARSLEPKPPRRYPVRGWGMTGSHADQYEFRVVPGESHEGRPVASLRCRASRPGGFGSAAQMFRADDYLGKRMRLAAWLRARDVNRGLGLWMRVDGPDEQPLAFDNCDQRALVGDTDWRRLEVVLDVDPKATAIALGVLLIGGGEGLVSGVEFEEVGPDVPTTDTTRREEPLPAGPTNLDFAS